MSQGVEAQTGGSVASADAGRPLGVCPLLVVIVNYKTADLTVRCLETLASEFESIPGARVTVVENASGDGETLARAIADRGWGRWADLKDAGRNGGFSAGNNAGIRPALESSDPPRFVLLLNADTEVRPGALRTLIAFMDANPGVGIAGSSFENLDGSDWTLAFRFFTPLGELTRGLEVGVVNKLTRPWVVTRFMEQDRSQPVDWVAGASMIVRREVFDAIGLMDEAYFLYFEEVDFCLQARRAGWPCWYVPQSRVMHIGGQSTKLTERNSRPKRIPAYWYESRSRYFRKNFGLTGAIVADLGFGVGFALRKLRMIVTRTPDPDPPHHLADFWKTSIFRKWSRGGSSS